MRLCQSQALKHKLAAKHSDQSIFKLDVLGFAQVQGVLPLIKKTLLTWSLLEESAVQTSFKVLLVSLNHSFIPLRLMDVCCDNTK